MESSLLFKPQQIEYLAHIKDLDATQSQQYKEEAIPTRVNRDKGRVLAGEK